MSNGARWDLRTRGAARARRSGSPRAQDAVEAKTGVFTDGACEGNPGPGGWAWVRVENDRIVAQDRGFVPETTTCNAMELRALIEAYRQLPEDAHVRVYSDSELCVRTVNQWARGWERRGWRRKGGRPIKNLALVQELYELVQARPSVELRWIRGHAGSRWNEYADALASGRAGFVRDVTGTFALQENSESRKGFCCNRGNHDARAGRADSDGLMARSPGRPKLPKSELRGHRLVVHLTNEEHATLRALAAEKDADLGAVARDILARALERARSRRRGN